MLILDKSNRSAVSVMTTNLLKTEVLQHLKGLFNGALSVSDSDYVLQRRTVELLLIMN